MTTTPVPFSFSQTHATTNTGPEFIENNHSTEETNDLERSISLTQGSAPSRTNLYISSNRYSTNELTWGCQNYVIAAK